MKSGLSRLLAALVTAGCLSCFSHNAFAIGTADGYVPVGSTSTTSMFGVYGGASIGTSYISTAAPTNGLIVQGSIGLGTSTVTNPVTVRATDPDTSGSSTAVYNYVNYTSTSSSVTTMEPFVNSVIYNNVTNPGSIYGNFFQGLVSGTTSSANFVNVLSRPYMQSGGNITDMVAFKSGPYVWTAGATGTITNMMGFYADTGAYGGSATSPITNWYQVKIDNPIAGTNKYGLYIAGISGGTSNYAIYSAGGQSYLAGNVGIATSSPASALHVNGVITAGVAGSTLGQIDLKGSASGTVSLKAPATAGTTNFTLPGSNGTSGFVLTTDGSGNTSWTAQTGSITGSGTANYVARWTAASTLGTGVLYDNGTSVGIGTNSPGALVDINGGSILFRGGLTNTSTRPAVSSGILSTNEIHASSLSGTTWDDGFLRISAGGGTSAAQKTYIDITGFSSGVPDMLNNIVFGAAGAERVRISTTGMVVQGSAAVGTNALVSDATLAAKSSSATGYAVYGSNSSTGSGLYGVNTSTGSGVQGSSTSSGTGVYGSNNGTGAGVYGTNTSTGAGVSGTNNSTGSGVSGSNSSTGYGVYGVNSAGGTAVLGYNSSTGYAGYFSATSGAAGYFTSASGYALITGTGNVGLGTTSPATALEVQSASNPHLRFRESGSSNYWDAGINSSTAFAISDAANGVDMIKFEPYGGTTIAGGNGTTVISAPHLSDNLYFVTGSGGNVGIGTTTASQKLTVNGNIDAMTGGYLTEIANATTTGTTVNKLAKISSGSALIAATTDIDGIVGIVVGGAGTSGSAQIAFGGRATCVFENAVTAGDYVTVGTGTAGNCRSAGTSRSSTSQTIGRALATAAAGASAAVALNITPSAASSGSITGSGTTNYVARWTSASALGTGVLYDNGTNVGIGTATPASKLDVYGAIDISGQNGLSFAPDATAGASIAIGSGALAYQAGTQSNYSVAIGYHAVGSSGLTTAAVKNTAVGYQALTANTSGYNNQAMGYNALVANTTGHENSATGFSALSSNTTGNGNTAVGNDALMYTNGNLNTGVGNQALFYGSGQGNTAVGAAAMFSAANPNWLTGDNNTAIGYYALLHLQTSSASNTAVGVNTGLTLTLGTNNLLLGANADVPAASTSNFVNIGNVVFATGASGSVGTPAGNVGIGTASPATNLHITSGTDSPTVAQLRLDTVNNSSNQNAELLYTSSGSNALYIKTNYSNTANAIYLVPGGATALSANGSGYVGINTGTPGSPLTVNGSATIGTSYVATTAPTNGLIVQGSTAIGTSTAVTNAIFTAKSSTASGYAVYAFNTAAGYGVYGSGASTGIGVYGTNDSTGKGVYGSNSSTGYAGYFSNTSSGIGGYFTSTSGYALITGTGNVGIGTASPASLLQVAGTATLGVSGTTAGQLVIAGSTSGSATIKTAAAAGTPSFTLPTTVGTSGYFLQTDGAGVLSWATPSASLPSLTSTYIWVGNGSNVATGVAMSGDCTLSNAGAITCTKTNGTAFGTLATLSAAPAGTLTGTTLASNVVTSSLTSVGTIATGVWNGTVITVPYGGTGLSSLTANKIYKGNGTSALAVSGLTDDGTTVSSSENISVTTKSFVTELANNTVTGTTLNYLATLSSGKAILAATSDTDGVLGIVIGGAGTSGSAQIATGGQASCVFDGAATTGNYVIASTSAAGKCSDGGASRPTSVQTIGRVLTTIATAGTTNISLDMNPPAANGGYVFGLGTANYVTRYKTASTIGTGVLYDNGTNVGVGTNSPASLFHVNGVTTIGLNGGTGGQIDLKGSGSGTVSLKAPAAAGTTNFTLPASNGTSGWVLTTDGSGNTSWAASGAGSLPSLTSTYIWVGNGSNVATGVAMSGDCTLSNAGAITCTKTGGVAFGDLATLDAAPAGTLTGTTLASNVVTSSLTSVGTIATGVWHGSAITVPYGGTGATTLTGYVYGNGTGAMTASTSIPYSAHPALAANQVLGALTATTPSGLSVPSCSTSASALLWTSGTGFSCNTAINAATLGGATFAAPGPIGGTTASTGAFTTVTATSFSGSGASLTSLNASNVASGTLAVSYGGTGLNTLTSNVIYKGNGTSAMAASGLTDNGTTVSSSENISLASAKGYLTEIANAGTTGTTANRLAKLSSGSAVIAGTSDTDGMVGVVMGGAGTSGNAQIAVKGQATCYFENATTAGDYVTIGTGTAGACRDAGATRPTSGQSIGRVLTAVAAGNNATVVLDMDPSATGSGAVTGTGTANYVARWTGTSALGTGALYDNATNVSVGTTSVGSKFNVYGGASIGTSFVATAAPTNGLIVQGSVGIGTSSPGAALHVYNGLASFSSSTGDGGLGTGWDVGIAGPSARLMGFYVGNSSSCGAYYRSGIYWNGYVSNTGTAGSSCTISAQPTYTPASTWADNWKMEQSGLDGSLVFSVAPYTSSAYSETAYVPVLSLDSNGLVGMGTNAPVTHNGSKLEVTQAGNTAVTVYNSSAAIEGQLVAYTQGVWVQSYTNHPLFLSVNNGSPLLTVGTNGNVGIGSDANLMNPLTVTGATSIGTGYQSTSAPSNGLIVQGSTAIGTSTAVTNAIFTAKSATASGYGVYAFNTAAGYGVYGSGASTGIGVYGTNDSTGKGVYGANSSTGYAGYFSNTSSGIGGYFTSTSGYSLITGTGNVGIGTTAPSTLLHVNGTITTGLSGTTAGQLVIAGSTSGSATIKTAAAAGTPTFTLPTTVGTSGYFLQTDGSGVLSWAQAGAVGTVTGTGTANYVARWTGTSSIGTGILYDSGTYVGIATTSPVNVFDVVTGGAGTYGNYAQIRTSGAAGYRGGLLITNSTGTTSSDTSLKITSSYNASASAGARIGFVSNSDTETYLNSGPAIELTYAGNVYLAQGGGKVGVGTTSVSYPLTVVGSNTTYLSSFTNGGTGAAIYGTSAGAKTIWGVSTLSGGAGVYGEASTGIASGVNGYTNSTTDGANGVYGLAGASSGVTYGVYGKTYSVTDGANGVLGIAVGTTGATRGVYGYTESTTNGAIGVLGVGHGATGASSGVYGITVSTTAAAKGVYGQAQGATGATYGVYGTNASTTAASAALYGTHTAATGASYGVYGSSASSTGYGGYFYNSNGGYAAAFMGGNVGIGTASPASLLQVAGTATLGVSGATAGQLVIAGSTSGSATIKTAAAAGTPTFTLPTTVGTSGYFLQTDGTGVLSWAQAGAVGTVTGTGTANYVARWTGTSSIGTGALYDNGTAVGIGTSSPGTSLDINGDVLALKIRYSSGAAPAVYAGQVSTAYGYFGSGYYSNANNWRTAATVASNVRFENDGSLSFTTNSGLTANTDYIPTTRMVISASGNVGIGSAVPANALDVHGGVYISGGSTAAITHSDSNFGFAAGYASPVSGRLLFGDGSGWKFHFSKGSASSPTDLVTIVDTGKVGIGTTSPTSLLTVYGGASIGTSYAGTAAPTNGLIVQGSTGIGTSSVSYPLSVYGSATYTNYVVNTASSGAAVYGSASAGTTRGVQGITTSTTDGTFGVAGIAAGATGVNAGVYGLTQSATNYAIGVYGKADSATGQTYGVWGDTFSTADNATGVMGVGNATSGASKGVWGQTLSTSADAAGVYGQAAGATGANFGVYGRSASSGGYAGYFVNSSSGAGGYFTSSSGYALITGSGNVGIGTTAPAYLLHAKGTIATGTAGTQGQLVIVGSTSGAATIKTAAAAGAPTFTLPTTVGTSGYFLQTDGAGVLSWAQASGGATGSGTANYVARWTSTSALGTGVLYDNGTNVSVGTTSVGSKFNVYGGATIGTSYVATAAPTNGLIVQGSTAIGTAAATTNLTIYNANESTTQTNFTQALTNAGINIMTDYTANAFTPGVFWSTSGATVPKAGMYMKETANGSYLLFGTSNNYTTGITNSALAIGYGGYVGIGSADPIYNLDVVGPTRVSSAALAGVYALTTYSGGYGVYGEANTGAATGVYGVTTSTTDDAMGVYGTAEGTTGNTFGVLGKNASNTALASGVYGLATGTGGPVGVLGISNATTGRSFGVYGATASTTDDATGVYGLADGATGATIGVLGESDSASVGATGIYGMALGTTAQNIGVRGLSASSTGYAGYFVNSSSGVGGYFTSASGYALVTGTGNVGIGTTAPASLLTVYGGATIGTAYAATASPTDGLLVSGSTAIGTTVPVTSASLTAYNTVAGGWGVYGRNTSGGGAGVLGYNSNGGHGVFGQSTTSGRGLYGLNSGAGYGVYGRNSSTGYAGYFAAASGVAGYFSSDTGYALVTGTGNVGIGTTAPTAALHVSSLDGSAAFKIVNSLGNTGFLMYDSDLKARFYESAGANNAVIGFAGTAGLGYNGGALNLVTNSTDRVTIDTSGNVGIGSATPQGSLDLLSAGNIFRINSSYGHVLLHNAATTAYWSFAPRNGGSFDLAYSATDPGTGYIAATSSYISIGTNGYVGIGTITPGALLDIGSAGTTRGTLRLEGNTSGYTQIQPAAAAGSWTMTLPATAGTSGYFLQTDGSGGTTWAAASGGSLSGGTANYVTRWLSGTTVGTGVLYDSGTYVGIGTSTVANLLTIKGSTASGAELADVVLDSSKWFTLGHADGYGYIGFFTQGDGTNFVNTHSTIPASVIRTGSTGGIHMMVSSVTGSGSTASLGYGLFIGSSGNVYIGDNTGASSLSVDGNVGVGTNYHTTAAPTDGLLVEGSVSIGTTSNAAKLDLRGASKALTSNSGILQVASTDTGGAADLGGSVVFSGYDGGTGGRVYAGIYGMKENSTSGNYSGYMAFGTRTNGSNNAERMRITSVGSVGIGTSSPAYMLHVTDGEGALGYLDGTTYSTTYYSGVTTALRLYQNATAANNSGPELVFASNKTGGTVGVAAIDGLITDISTSAYKGALVFKTANNATAAERMRIDYAGNVGIGTTTPGALLDVGSAGATLGTLRLEGNTSGYTQIQPAAAAGSWTMTLPSTAGTSGYFLQTNGSGVTTWAAASGGSLSGGTANYVTRWTSATTVGTGVLYDNATNVGIGTANPSYKLHVSGGASLFGELGSTSNGGIMIPSDNAYGYFRQSDSVTETGSDSTGWEFVTSSSAARKLYIFNSGTGTLGLNVEGTITSGVAGATGGQIDLKGSGSGTVSIKAPATAGTTTFQLPASNGTSGQFLQTNGSGVTTWATASGGGLSGGTANMVARWTGASAIGTGILYDNGAGVGINSVVPSTDYLFYAGTDGGTSGNSYNAGFEYVNTSTDPFGLLFIKSKPSGSVTSSDYLGYIAFMGRDVNDSAYSGAQIISAVDGTPAAGKIPGNLQFVTRASSSGTLAERMRITNDGKVAIGTTSAYAPLHVNQTSSLASMTTNTAFNGMVMQGPTASSTTQYVGWDFMPSGTAKPMARIGIAYDTDFGTNIVFGVSNSWATGITSTPLTLTYYGGVGIGTSSPQVWLHTYAASGAALRVQSGSYYCDHTATSSAETVACSSDARLKDNIVDTGSALQWLGDMRVRDFTLKAANDNVRHTGVIAQEIQKTHPEMVHLNKDGYYTVDEPDPWRLVKAIQELKKLFDGDHEEITKLKAENAAQAKDIQDLKALIDKQGRDIDALKRAHP